MKNRILLFIFLLLVLLSSCAKPGSLAAEPLDTTPRVAVLSAFSPELQDLHKKLELQTSYVINGRTFYTGTLSGQEVVLSLTGVSMVNAAMAAQTTIDHFNVQAMIFSGIAGGVNPELSIGDVVIPAQWGQYQEQLFAREDGENWDTGTFSAGYGNFGMMFPQDVSVVRPGGKPDEEEKCFWFPVSPEMLGAAENLVGTVDLEDCTLLAGCLEKKPQIVLGGNGVSGQTFVDNASYRTWVWDTFQADAVDMESAAIAHVAYVHGIPFIAFRSLSDLAGGGPGENEVGIFYRLAAENSSSVVIAFLEVWDPPLKE
jgi:adenosylhomocysteine nucleosidase